MSRRSQINQAFLDKTSSIGKTERDIISQSKWSNSKTNTQGTTTRYRSNSITETHYHGSATRLGTATHTDRNGSKSTIAKYQMNADTKNFARNRY